MSVVDTMVRRIAWGVRWSHKCTGRCDREITLFHSGGTWCRGHQILGWYRNSSNRIKLPEVWPIIHPVKTQWFMWFPRPEGKIAWCLTWVDGSYAFHTVGSIMKPPIKWFPIPIDSQRFSKDQRGLGWTLPKVLVTAQPWQITTNRWAILRAVETSFKSKPSKLTLSPFGCCSFHMFQPFTLW